MSRFPYCLIILVMSRCGGKSESRVEVCVSQDADILFPNTPTSSASDIMAKTWTKTNGIRVASWMVNKNFVPSPSYGNRLMAIGENSIKIRNATRSDTGTYTLVLTSGSTQAFTESISHLEVLGLVPGMYTACAIGKSIRCFHEDVYKLCSNYTVSALKPQNDSSSVSVIGILVLSIFYIVIGVVLSLMHWKREPIKRKLFSVTVRNEILNNPNEESALTKEDTAAKELTSKVKATAETRNKDTKLQEKLQMQQKQEYNPGSYYSGEKEEVQGCEGIQGIQSREEPIQEEQRLFKERELTSKVKATAGTRNKDTKLQEKLQMQQKQGHDSGSYDSRVEEGLQGIQSREDPIQEEQRIFNERDEKMNEGIQRIQDQLLCRICQTENACIVFLPCSHHIACFACAQKLKNCNFCGQEIKCLIMPFTKN